MKKFQKKEQNLRNIYKKNEIYRQIYFTLIKNKQDLTKQENFLLFLHYQKTFKFFTKIRINNRCLITLRSNAVYTFFKLSRLTLQELIQKNCIPGLKISSW